MAFLKIDTRVASDIDLDVAPAPAVDETRVVAPVLPPPQPVIWGLIPKPSDPAADTAAAVGAATGSGSARAAAWGPARSSVIAANRNRDRFVGETPDAQRAELSKVKAEREAVGAKVTKRVAELDARWNSPSMRTWTKVEALRQYHERTQHLRHGPRGELDKAVTESEQAQRDINALRAKSDTMCRPDDCTQSEKAERDEVAGQLADAREAQKQAVVKATGIVDNQGLKVERLALTEQLIDPDAPAEGLGGTLLAWVEEYFDLSALMEVFEVILEEEKKAAKKADAEKQERMEDERELADNTARILKREQALKELNARYLREELARKRQVQAVNQRAW